jgi:hypothetical protein
MSEGYFNLLRETAKLEIALFYAHGVRTRLNGPAALYPIRYFVSTDSCVFLSELYPCMPSMIFADYHSDR